MSNLKLQNVTKIFRDGSDEVVAVDDVNMEIEDGEFVVIVGPSGCGKTTTLRAIAGLETITEGEIVLDDDEITGLRPAKRDIAMVFQSYALYPHMTVRENMSFGLEHSTEFHDDEIAAKVERIAELLGIEELLDRHTDELSGGQQQRVALGRAIVREPSLFLLDEPLSNLDAKLRAQMRTELQRLQNELGTTTIYVTHDQVEAMTMGDRIAIFDRGRLQQVGTPMECYYEPANRFVAGFIGEPSMNFIRCTREADTLHCDGFEYRLSEKTVQQLEPVTDLTLGVRPEDVEILPAPRDENGVYARVDVVEPFGKENNLYLFPRDGDLDEAVVATIEGQLHVEEGREVAMCLPEDALYLFDRNSGDAVRHPEVEREELSILE